MRAERRATTARVIEIPLERLDEGTNVRTERRRPSHLDYGLTASVRAHGILQPITVCRRGSRYEILFGHRRAAAARAAGLATVPAIVEPAPADRPLLQLVENEHRRRVDPMGIARALRATLAAHPGMTQTELARAISRQVSWVNQHLALLELDELTAERVAAGRIGVQRAIDGLRASTPAKAVGRPRILRLDGEAGRSASVVVPLEHLSPKAGRRGRTTEEAGKATIGLEHGSGTIELILEDATGHGVMLTLDVASAHLLGRRLGQAASAAAGSAPRAPGSGSPVVQVSSGPGPERRLPRPALPAAADAERTA